MKSGTTTWTCALAVAALLTAPVAGGHAATAQVPSPDRPATPAEVQETESGQRRLADEHLRKAHAALAEIPADQQPAQVQAHISELKRRISALQHADDEARAAAPDRRAADPTPAPKVEDRQAELSAIERTFMALIGKDRTTGAPAVPDTVGTTGAAPVLIDEATRARLEQARTHVTAYAAAIGSAERTKDEADAAPATVSPPGPPGSPVPDAGDATAITSPVDPTPTPTGTSPTDTPQIPAIRDSADRREEPRAGPPHADMEAARRHLLAARNTLSHMTQMPQAAAITGEARAQISLLISQFNQLIAANIAWRDALPPVKANLERLLMDTPATVERVETDPDHPEPVGTTGGMALDPQVRAQLVEFRTHLEAFERAASLKVMPADRAEPADPSSATTAGPGEVATRVSETDPTAASGSTSTGAPAADMPGPTADVIGGEPMTPAKPVPDDALRHIEAIEAILVRDAPRDDALASEDVQEIRRHLDELRRLFESRGR